MMGYDLDAGLTLPRYFSLMSSTEYAFADEIAAFVDCVATGKTPVLDPLDARAAVAMALAAHESASTGRTVRFEGSPRTSRGVATQEVGV